MKRTRKPVEAPPPRWLMPVAWLSLGLAVIVLFGVWPISGGDLWMWLTMGRYTWEHGGPPEEANRALRHCPHEATFAWFYKAEALWLLGRHQESFEAKIKIPERLIIY
jgi:hypothetical protein